MTGRRVEKVTAVSATSSSAPVDIWQTNSIFTDPDGRWVAKRQSAINVALEQRHIDPARASSLEDRFSLDGAHEKNGEASPTQDHPPQKFSGESDRIGQGNLSESAPFGKYVGYV